MASLNSVNGIALGGQAADITPERLEAFNNKYGGTYANKTSHPDDMEIFRVANAGPGNVRQMEPRTVSWFDKLWRWVKSFFVTDTTMQETSRAFYNDVRTAFNGNIPDSVKTAMGEHGNGAVDKPLLLSDLRNVQTAARKILDDKATRTTEVRNADSQQPTEEGESDEIQSQGGKPIKGQNDEERKIKDDKFVNSHLNPTEEKKNELQQRAALEDRVAKRMEEQDAKKTPEQRKEDEKIDRENMFYARQNHDDTKMVRKRVETTLKQELAEQGLVNKGDKKTVSENTRIKTHLEENLEDEDSILDESGRNPLAFKSRFNIDKVNQIVSRIAPEKGEVNESKTEKNVPVTQEVVPETDKEDKKVPANVPNKVSESGGGGKPHPDVKELTTEKILRGIETRKNSVGVGEMILYLDKSTGRIAADVGTALVAIKEKEVEREKEFEMFESRKEKANFALNVLEELYGNSLANMGERVSLLGGKSAAKIISFFGKEKCNLEEFDAMIAKLQEDKSEAIVTDAKSAQHASFRFAIVRNVLAAYIFGLKVK